MATGIGVLPLFSWTLPQELSVVDPFDWNGEPDAEFRIHIVTVSLSAPHARVYNYYIKR